MRSVLLRSKYVKSNIETRKCSIQEVQKKFFIKFVSVTQKKIFFIPVVHTKVSLLYDKYDDLYNTITHIVLSL